MKINLSSSLAITALLAAPLAHAANLYWDGATPAGAPGGGVGTWNHSLSGNTANWDTSLAGTDVAWVNANLDTAVFGGTAGAVTLGADIDVGGLRFDTTGYIIDGETNTQTLSFASGDNAILLNNIAGATINGQLGGTGANVILSRTNTATAGILTLGLTSTAGWTGTTTINAGTTLLLNGANRGLSSTSGITLNGGGITLANTNNTQGAFDRVASAGITSNGGTFTYTNTSGSGLVYAETLGTLGLMSGQSNIVLTNDMAGGGGNLQTLTLSGLTRTGASNTSTITFSATSTGPNATTNIINNLGFGGVATPAGQIIGPWATTGTAANVQNKWAVYDGSGNITADSIADTSDDSTWTTASNAYSLNTGALVTINTTSTITALRFLGAASSLTLGTGNLETYGLAFTGTNTKTVDSTGGALTTPTGGGSLYLMAGNSGASTITAPINNNSGAVTVVVGNAAGRTLNLTSTTGNYSGGTVINSGILNITNDAHLGAAGGSITLNGGQLKASSANISSARAVIVGPAGGSIAVSGNNNFTTSGTISGSGDLTFGPVTGAGGQALNFNSTLNTFTGGIFVPTNYPTLNFNSLADSAKNIVFNGAVGGTFTYGTGAVAPLVLNGRAFQFSQTAGGQTLGINSNSTTPGATMTVNTDLIVNGTGTSTLSLGGTNTGTNVFAGRITDGPAGAVGVTKTGGGTWVLSGANTYTGKSYNNSSNGTLIFQHVTQSLPSASALTTAITNNQNQFTRLLSDTSGSISLGNTIRTDGGGSSGTGTMTFFVGNNSAANGGNGAGGTTGSTIVMGTLDLRSSSEGGLVDGRMAARMGITGANGYRLEIGDVIMQAKGSVSAAGAYFIPTTAPLTISGTVKQNNGRTGADVAALQTLTLDGTANSNLISGAIKNATDFDDMTNVNALATSVSKSNLSDWTLSGNNTYSGGTTITTGKLTFSGASALPTTGTIAVGANGHLSLADGTARNQTVSALTLTSLANLSFDWTGSNTGDQLTSTADITPTAASRFAVNLNRSGTPGGSVTLLTGGASSTLSSSTFYLANATDYTATLSTPTVDTLVVNGYAAQTALTTLYWQGNKLAGTATAGVDNAWALSNGTVSNWSSADGTYAATALTPGSTANVIFSNTLTDRAQQSTVLGSDVTVNSVVIADATTVTIAGANGAALTLMSSVSTAGTVGGTPGSAITVTSTAANPTISSRVNLGANQTWNVASSKTLRVDGVVGGNFSLTKADAGIVILNGVNTYTGDTTISAGTLQIGVNGGTATLGGGFYAGNILNNGTLDIQTSANQTLSGVISGSGSLVHRNTGTLTLTGANTYTGTTTINAITNTPSPTLVVSSFNSVNGGTPLLASSSLGAPTTVANGTIIMGSNNSSPNPTLRYTGTGETTDRVINFFFNSGSIRTLDASGTGPLKFTSAFTQNGAATGGVTLTGTGTGELAGALPVLGSGAFTKSGVGTWTLSGANAFRNPTTVSAGTLVARSSSALGDSSFSTTNVSITAGAALNYVAATDTALNIGGTLTINGGTNTTIGGSIGSTATSAQINVAGNALVPTTAVRVNIYGVEGVSRLAGTNTYTLISGLGGGATTLNNGTYTLGTVYNNTDFTVSNITKSTTGVFIDVTQQTAMTGAFFIGGLAGAGNVWSASNGSSASNFSATSGGASQALVPGSGTNVFVDNNSFAANTVLGADMRINGLTLSDNNNHFALTADGYGLTIGSGGITKNNTTPRTAAIGSNLVLGAAQTWSNADTGNALMVSGIITGVNDLIVTGAGNTSVSGRIMTGAGTLTKNGAGTLTLSGNNTYTGTTTVTDGTLLINGTHTGGGLITVEGGATLGGSGTMGDVTVDNLGILAPGTSPGQITVDDLTLNDTSVLAFELGAPTLVPAPGFSDHIVVNGNLTLNGKLQVAAIAGFPGSPLLGDKWLLLSYGGTLTDNTLVVDSAPSGTYVIDTDTAGSVFLVAAIPEAGTAGLLALGLLLLRRLRRGRAD